MMAGYLRGMSYLAARQGAQAAAEFLRILGRPSITGGSFTRDAQTLPRIPAHIGLGRAYALQGDTAKARKTYPDFLAPWKDANPTSPS
jgi:hypothetical protein